MRRPMRRPIAGLLMEVLLVLRLRNENYAAEGLPALDVLVGTCRVGQRERAVDEYAQLTFRDTDPARRARESTGRRRSALKPSQTATSPKEPTTGRFVIGAGIFAFGMACPLFVPFVAE